MKTYLENMIEEVENKVDISTMPETAKTIAEAKEILRDEKFIIQKGVRSLVDKDARVGHKSKTDSFYGYKKEFTMIPVSASVYKIDENAGEKMMLKSRFPAFSFSLSSLIYALAQAIGSIPFNFFNSSA